MTGSGQSNVGDHSTTFEEPHAGEYHSVRLARIDVFAAKDGFIRDMGIILRDPGILGPRNYM